MTTEAVIDFIQAISENIEGTGSEWQEYSVVLVLTEERLSGSYGYAYPLGEQAEAIAVRPRFIRPQLEAYLSDHFPSGAVLPVKLLIQFNRISGHYNIEFEDKDPTRWQVTPANIDTIREELRPRLD